MTSDEAVVFDVDEATHDDAHEIAVLQFEAWQHDNPEDATGEQRSTASFAERERHWSTRLSLHHGMDYFALVARRFGDPRIFGFADAGASRDHDRRGFGELYDLVVDPTSNGDEVSLALVNAVVDRLQQASFIGAHLLVPSNDQRMVDLLASLGWVCHLQPREMIIAARSTPASRFELSWSFNSPT